MTPICKIANSLENVSLRIKYMHDYTYTFIQLTKYGSWLLCAHRATEWHSIAVKAKFRGFNHYFYSLLNEETNFIVI